MSSSSSWEEVRQERMKMGDDLIHSSTPVEGPYVIGDSPINTNSSRNILRFLLTRTAKAKKKQKLAGAKRENKPAEAKNKPKKHVSSDSDWLITEEQLTDNEKENLYEDAASPELVREDQVIHEYKFDSLVRQRHKYALSPVRVKGDAEKIPVKDLKHLRTVFDISDEEEELLPRRSDPVRTYDIKIHTTPADMLLDEYVGEHQEEMRVSIGPPAVRRKVFTFFVSKNKDSNKSDKGKATKKEDWRTKKTIVKDLFEFSVPKDDAVENFTYSEYKQITASSTEFQRHDDLCSYATRLEAKGQEMLSENVAKNSNVKSLVSALRTTRKRASKVNKDVSKRANIAVNKPTIRSVKDLEGIRYVKEKDHWRIIYVPKKNTFSE